MNYLCLLIFLLLFTNCHAQKEPILIGKRLISDLSDTPIYSRLTEKINDKIAWKKEFQYIDSIEIHGIT